MTRSVSLGWLLGLWSLFCVVGSARAQAHDARSEASAHFRQGVALFREGAFAAALVELERAYAVMPDYRVLYNIGQAASELGDFVTAERALSQYLDKGGPLVDDARRREVEADLEVLSQRIATLSIHVDEVGATVLVDGRDVGTSPLPASVRVSAGRHRIEALGDFGHTATVSLDVAGRDVREVSLRLSHGPTLATVSAVVVPEPPAQAPVDLGFRRRKRIGVGMLVTGSTLAVASGVMGLSFTLAARDDYERARDRGDSDVAARRAEFEREAMASKLLGASAVAFGVAGALLMTLEGPVRLPGQEHAAVIGVGVSPTGATVRGAF